MFKQLKSWLPDVLAVVFFAILGFAYFYPAVVENRVLNQGDVLLHKRSFL